MFIVKPALALFASSLLVASAPPSTVFEATKPFAVPMFHPPAGTGRGDRLAPLRSSSPAVTSKPSLVCHIIVIEADPKIDPKMAVEAPVGIDPKIVQRSQCAEPAKD